MGQFFSSPPVLVIRGHGDFASKLVSTRPFKKGDVVSAIPHRTADKVTYQTVQTGKSEHIYLNDDLVFSNHSCDPNTRWDLKNFVVIAERDIAEGEELTWFYPCSEWDMAQPFQCHCGSPHCLGKISGAKYIAPDILRKYPVTDFIAELKKEQINQAMPPQKVNSTPPISCPPEVSLKASQRAEPALLGRKKNSL